MNTYKPIGLAYSTTDFPRFLQVLVTNLDVESVTHLEPANFWIGPSAVSYFIQEDKCLHLEN